MLTGGGLNKSGGEDFILTDMNLPTKPPPVLTGVRTVVHQVHYQSAPQQGGRWANTYDALASADHDHHDAQINDLRQYDVSITAGG